MHVLTFYATPDATQAFDDMAARWFVPPGRALLRLTQLGMDTVEALQMARDWAPPIPWRSELPDPGPRFRYFDEAGAAAGVSPLPPGSRRFPLLLDDGLAQRLDKAARRENAWRLAGLDPARRPPTMSLHEVIGWAACEALIAQGHPLFPATKPHQLKKVRTRG